MNRTISTFVVGLAAAFALGATVAYSQSGKSSTEQDAAGHAPASQQGQNTPEPPPGVDPATMQACIEAATPGPMHAFLAEGVGTWKGKNKMWMGPDSTEPMLSECTMVITPIMEGRFTRADMAGQMPEGMGMFNGLGIYGYDNVAKTFQCAWVDNMGTTMAFGTGERSEDGKTMTWTLTYTCPIQKKPVTMREVDRITGPDSRTMEMWGIDPVSGKEFKMMEIESVRTAKTRPTSHGH